MSEKHLFVEAPDSVVTIDFAGTGSRKKADRRACTVTVSVEGGKLYIKALGCDDRATILCDAAYDIPEEDRRR